MNEINCIATLQRCPLPVASCHMVAVASCPKLSQVARMCGVPACNAQSLATNQTQQAPWITSAICMWTAAATRLPDTLARQKYLRPALSCPRWLMRPVRPSMEQATFVYIYWILLLPGAATSIFTTAGRLLSTSLSPPHTVSLSLSLFLWAWRQLFMCKFKFSANLG